jgi:hypothetical protein
MGQVGVVRVAGRAVGVLGLLLVVSCGGEDGEGVLPTPTRTPTATLPTPTRSLDLPTPTLPSPDLPTPTRSPDLPTPTLPSPDLPTPTRSPDPTSSPEEPTTEPAEPTSEPTTAEPTTREPEPATTAPTPEATEESDDPSVDAADGELEDDGVPVWVWWLLGVLVVGAVVAVLLVLRAGRRRAWRQEVDEAEGELAWLARELLPGLRQSGSREQLAGGWSVSRERVAAAEDRLTVLESSAPTEADGQRARSLRDAVRAASARMEQLTGPEPVDTWTRDVDAVIADLEAVLRPPPPPSRQ